MPDGSMTTLTSNVATKCDWSRATCPSLSLWREYKAAEKALDEFSGNESSTAYHEVSAAHRESQDRFLYAQDATPLGILLKLEMIDELEGLAGHLDQMPHLLWPRVIMTLLRDLRASLNNGNGDRQDRATLRARPTVVSPGGLQFSPQAIVDVLVAAVLPLIDEDGEGMLPGKTDIDVVSALSPAIGHITVETAVFLYGLLNLAEDTHDRGVGATADRQFAAFLQVKWILEDFASHARATSPACAAARSRLALIKSANVDCGEDYNDEGIRRSVAWDIRDMRSNQFHGCTFGKGYSDEPMWLMNKKYCIKEWSPRT